MFSAGSTANSAYPMTYSIGQIYILNMKLSRTSAPCPLLPLMPLKSEARKSPLSLIPEGIKLAMRISFENEKCKLLRHEMEKSRQLELHYAFRHFLHGNFQCHLEDALERGIKVIDVSCGSGFWTLEMARDFPNSTFVGTDVASHLFPQEDVPQNCSFVRADTRKGLPFEDGEFDFTFQRMVNHVYPPEVWEKVIAELTRVTKKGGWVELVESAGVIQRAPPNYQQYEDAWLAAASDRGIDFNISRDLGGLLNRSSLTSIESDYICVSIGWNGRAGEALGRYLEMYRLAIKKWMAPLMRMSEEEYEQWAVTISRQLAGNKSWGHAYYAYGRKT